MRLKKLLLVLSLVLILCGGCGKDSYITRTAGPEVSVEFGTGIELVTATETCPCLFDEFPATTFNGHPAISLKDLIKPGLVAYPELYGYRFIGTDGFYANMPGKGYGDNSWSQLSFGYLDLTDFSVIFQTQHDSNLRNGHNIKWLIQIQLLRSIDICFDNTHKLSSVEELDTVTLSGDYADAGAEGIALIHLVIQAIPANLDPEASLYRVQARTGDSLPRLLSWTEMETAFYLPATDIIALPASLGDAYQLEQPLRITLEELAR